MKYSGINFINLPNTFNLKNEVFLIKYKISYVS